MTYLEFIENCRNKDYGNLLLHRHHIIPRSEGGNNTLENIINISIKDHYLAHKIHMEETGINSGALSLILHNLGVNDFDSEVEFNEAEKLSRKLNAEAQKNNHYALGHIYKHTEEAKKSMSEKRKGKKYALGSKHTEEWKKKASERNKGKIFSEEHKEKLRQANLGKKMSEESKKKMSEAKKGNKSHLGFKHTNETKEKLKNAHLGKNIYNDGNKEYILFSDDPIIKEKNLIHGHKKSENHGKNKNKLIYNDGVKNYMMLPDDPLTKILKFGSFNKKIYQKALGKKCFNDGVKNYMLFENDEKIIQQNLKLGKKNNK